MKSTALTTTTTITSSQEEGVGGPSYEAVLGEEEEDEAAYTGSNEVLEDLGMRSIKNALFWAFRSKLQYTTRV